MWCVCTCTQVMPPVCPSASWPRLVRCDALVCLEDVRLHPYSSPVPGKRGSMRPRDRKGKLPVIRANRINFSKRKQEQERGADRKFGEGPGIVGGSQCLFSPCLCSHRILLMGARHQVGPGLRGVLGLLVLQRDSTPSKTQRRGGPPAHTPVLPAG